MMDKAALIKFTDKLINKYMETAFENICYHDCNVSDTRQAIEEECCELKYEFERLLDAATNPKKETPLETAMKRREKKERREGVPQRLIDCYQNNISRNFITPIELDNLAFWCGRVEPDVIEWAIGEAVSHKAANWSYIKKILENHANAGRTTLAAVKDASRKWSPEKEFDVYKSDVDHEAIEKIIMGKL